MKTKYRLMTRGARGNLYYCVDTSTGKRTSLNTSDRDAAEQIVLAKNQALRQPALNLSIAKAYIAGSDCGVATRTWQEALESLVEGKRGATQERWKWAAKERAFDSIRKRPIIETQAAHLLAVLKAGTISTNVHLRKLYNYCLDMGWLPWPILPKRQWPAVEYKEKRAITLAEHQTIVAREPNTEFRTFYRLLWEVGGSQSDVASLTAESIDWQDRVIAYHRMKTGSVACLHFGNAVAQILETLPKHGLLFPRLARMHERHRGKEFNRRCKGLGIAGVSLHSYRYAWAERAKAAGYPERFAQEALGHTSKAVHRAYARKASMKLPSLEEYERNGQRSEILPFITTTVGGPPQTIHRKEASGGSLCSSTGYLRLDPSV